MHLLAVTEEIFILIMKVRSNDSESVVLNQGNCQSSTSMLDLPPLPLLVEGEARIAWESGEAQRGQVECTWYTDRSKTAKSTCIGIWEKRQEIEYLLTWAQR